MEHFERYSNFSYYAHSSVYRVFWPSDQVVDCNNFFGYWARTADIQNYAYSMKSLTNFQMLWPQISNFVHIKGLIFCILSKVSIYSRTYLFFFHPLFLKKSHFKSYLWRCSDYHSTHTHVSLVKKIHNCIYKATNIFRSKILTKILPF